MHGINSSAHELVTRTSKNMVLVQPFNSATSLMTLLSSCVQEIIIVWGKRDAASIQ